MQAASRTYRQNCEAFLAGQQITLEQLEHLRKACEQAHDIGLARQILTHARLAPNAIRGFELATRGRRDKLAVREAQFTSKDADLSSAYRHDEAMRLLADRFGRLEDPDQTDAEVLGVAGGICKRRWQDLGQHADLRRAADFYERGAKAGLGEDAYCQINAAFLERLLAAQGDEPERRLARAKSLWQDIVARLPAIDSVRVDMRWWNAASRAEAQLGLGAAADAAATIGTAMADAPAPWERETTVRQFAELAHLTWPRPMDNPDVCTLFDLLVPGSIEAIPSAVLGRVGLALSGGGFRASFYHLGVLARMAELDMLRHVSVLSCVSGGSIVGACYWLLLRKRLRAQSTLHRDDYVALVRELITHFRQAVDTNLRAHIQPKLRTILKDLFRGQRGLLDPEASARMLHTLFYAPLAEQQDDLGGALYMDQLAFDPHGFKPRHAGARFSPGIDNWLRRDKVPELVINATTLNTGHAWQFTPTWMGESPWAVDEAADALPRLEWAYYNEASTWRIQLARAVAASAGVPGVFAPLRLDTRYEDGVIVRLADGGVHDNQGTVALLATNCNIVLVSDACGQLLFERCDSGPVAFAKRAMDMLMERVRLANHGHLLARRRSGLLRGLMFLHMKSGLDADTWLRVDSQATQTRTRQPLSPSGVRKDLQQALSELRTDLDDFSQNEQLALMACGYLMAKESVAVDLANISGLVGAEPATPVDWDFNGICADLISTAEHSSRRQALLQELQAGSKVSLEP